jgi:hypothetical protein
VVRLISSDGTSSQDLEKENTFYVVKTNDGLGTASVKEFRDSRDFLDATKDWFDSSYKNGMKDSRGLYIKTNNKESLYRFGMSDTIALSIPTIPNKEKQLVSNSSIPLPMLGSALIEINLSENSVDWTPEGTPTQDQPTRSWFVEAKGNEVQPTKGQKQRDQQLPPKSFSIVKATLKIDWKKDESEIVATLTIADGGIKPDPDAKKLKSVEELTKQVKDSELRFDLILKQIELTWDKDRKVDVKTPLKVRFVEETAK